MSSALKDILPKLKAIEPTTYSGNINKIDYWFYGLEMYFRALKLDFEDKNANKCAIVAGVLLKGVALNFHKRLYCTK